MGCYKNYCPHELKICCADCEIKEIKDCRDICEKAEKAQECIHYMNRKRNHKGIKINRIIPVLLAAVILLFGILLYQTYQNMQFLKEVREIKTTQDSPATQDRAVTVCGREET